MTDDTRPRTDPGLAMPQCILDHDHNHDEGDCVYRTDPVTPDPLRQAVLTEFDNHRIRHGESCDCDLGLVLGNLSDAALAARPGPGLRAIIQWAAGQPAPGDWACAECRPASDMLSVGFRCAVHAARAALAAGKSVINLHAPEPGLTEAWAEAEAALPDGWTMLVGREINRPYSYWATASSPREDHGGYTVVSTSHDGTLRLTAADAVRELVSMLASRLREGAGPA